MSLDSVASDLASGSSRSVRAGGMNLFGKSLAEPEQWEQAWRAVGGTKGLVNILAEGSVADLKALVREIGNCNHVQRRVKARETAIGELLHALLPLHYPGSELQSHEKRPVQHHYGQMVCACSAEFVEELLDAKDTSNPLYQQLPVKRLIVTHPEPLRRRILNSIFGSGKVDDFTPQFLKAFVFTQPPWPGKDPKISESMSFAMTVISLRMKDIHNDTRWPDTISEVDIVHSLVQRSFKRNLPEEKLHHVIILGLELLEAKPKLLLRFKSKNFWSKLLTRWRRDHTMYDEAFIRALRLGLGGSETTIIQDFLQTARAVKATPEWRWRLLRLYFLHVPNNGVDIDVAANFKFLANRSWPTEIFYYLRPDESVRLLQHLQAVNQDYSFLAGPRVAFTEASILARQDIKSQKNFNVSLLLALLQRGSENSQLLAQNEVDGLRKRAAIAREQPDRAHFAKAASDYAIASGSLDLYGATIEWQQRFVRDPLTVKVIFGREAIMTTEGLQLLSGVPSSGDDIKDFTSRAGKANEILIGFYETMALAKREPSFHHPDWKHVEWLFGAVIHRRVEYAKECQKSLQSSDEKLYAEIWVGTLAMLENTNIDFFSIADLSIRDLLKALSPTALATATKALLDIGDQRRKKGDRQPGDATLELLSYSILIDLANGERPELAKQLILRTILNRPDASSWHRQLLSLPLLNSLSAKDAHEILLQFATEISEKLEEQSYVKIGEVAGPPKPPQSLVKVTTVKYLAQLLDNAEYISEEAAVEVLVELFKSGTHRDIRLATLDSLLNLLGSLCGGAYNKWRSNPLVEKILIALDSVVPIVGSINENRPPRLEVWKDAKETGTVPEISEISTDLPPLINAVLAAPNGVKYPGLKDLRAEFMSCLFLPILELSQAEHRKWIDLFLAKHKASFLLTDLPSTPVSPQIWTFLVNHYPDILPQSVLEDFNRYSLLTITRPAFLEDFHNSLLSHPETYKTPEVQHWLAIFRPEIDCYRLTGVSTLVPLIKRDWSETSISNGISSGKLESMVLEYVSLFLDDYEKYQHFWDIFTESLQPPTKMNSPGESDDSIRPRYLIWQERDRAVLQKIIALVHDRKKSNDQALKRDILPSTTKLCLWLLPYPQPSDTTLAEEQCEAFVKKWNDLLRTFLDSETKVLRWSKIAEDTCIISKMLNTEEERLRIADIVARSMSLFPAAVGDRLSTVLNYIRVELVLRLVEDGREWAKKPAKIELSEQQKTVIRNLHGTLAFWKQHSDEVIREKVSDWARERKDVWKTLVTEE